MSAIAIIGAGITGLVAGWELKRRGLDVRLYEAGSRPGGVIRTIRRDGFIAESGPNTILETAPEIRQLISRLGLDDQKLYSAPTAEKRFIIRRGKAVPMPPSPLGFLTTPLFSAQAKLALLLEPFVVRSPADQEESLANFVRRRLGQEFLDYAINPFVAGVYAGDPARLSVREAFPKLHALEQRYGSLLLGQMLGARERKKRGTISNQNAPKVSFIQGLDHLTTALGNNLQGQIAFQHSLHELEQTVTGWKLTFTTPEGTHQAEFDQVLLCAPAFKLAEVQLRALSKASLSFLSQISYAPVSTLALGFRRDQVRHPLNGFGFLVPEVERLHTLGAIFSSSLFPDRAPQNHVLITCYLGGSRNPDLPFASPDAQIALASEDLANILGISGQPVFTNLVVHKEAIPQYQVGYGKLRARMNELENRCPGLHLAGNWRNGISLGDSILSGLSSAGRMASAASFTPIPARA